MAQAQWTAEEAAGVASPPWTPPSPRQLAWVRAAITPWRWITAPRCTGLDHVPGDRPYLLVGNHTLMGVLDVPVLALVLNERLGLYPRGLGDHAHFRIPGWGPLLERLGVVDGTPENCRALLAAGETVIVFPGGAREVFKRRHEKYELVWQQRTGFARLAIEAGLPIVPFSALGAEDAYDVLLDADDLLASPLGPWIRRCLPRPDLVPPLVRGWGPTLLPRPVRLYFRFAPPVETAALRGREEDPEARRFVSERVRGAIEAGLGQLMLERARDPGRTLAGRLLRSLYRRVGPA